jgi:integrase/recombinase XerD
MLSVYTRHHPDCAKKDDSAYRRRCPKWLDGTLLGRSGRFRVSAKTKSWEQAELLARNYENSARSGEDPNPIPLKLHY